MTDLSIIIVNFRSWKRLKICLDSISKVPQTRFSHEVIIIDNASKDGYLEKFRKNYLNFSFIENNGNNGFANGCNLGAVNAKGEYLLFLNPDTVVTEHALFGMLQKARSCTNSIISCRQLKESGGEEKSYGIFINPLTLTGWLRALRKIIYGPIEKGFRETPECIYPDWISGAVVLISRSNYDHIGGWDEDFWMYHEDVDFCKRARGSGMEVVLLKNITVEHNHGGASRINPFVTALTKTEVIISRHVYVSKHTEGFKALCLHLFLILNNLISTLIPALLGLIFFFATRLRVYTLVWFSLIKYYINCLLKSTWLSRRSVNYRK